MSPREHVGCVACDWGSAAPCPIAGPKPRPDTIPEVLPAGTRALSGNVATSELRLATTGHYARARGPYYYGRWKNSEGPEYSINDCLVAGIDWASVKE